MWVYLKYTGSAYACFFAMADRVRALKRLQCGRVVPGWFSMTLATWVPPNLKPSVQLLREEVARRAAHTGIAEPSTKNYSGAKLLAWLASHEACPGDLADDQHELATLAAEDESAAAAQVRWKQKTMLPLLVNVCVYLKDDFLRRDSAISNVYLWSFVSLGNRSRLQCRRLQRRQRKPRSLTQAVLMMRGSTRKMSKIRTIIINYRKFKAG